MQAASDFVPGADLALMWALPFAALLLSIALLPLLAPSFWHRHYGKVALAPVVALVRDANGAPRDAAVFVATGALSAYLDNAPTYVVFFNLFGGDAAELAVIVALL
jgi:Na+/H+ antiporter NhaD/arsenite permease-like protein